MVVFSLNITAHTTLLKIVLPILYIGNNITDGNFPDRLKFKKFSIPTHTPRATGTTSFLIIPCSLGVFGFRSSLSRMIKEAIPVNSAEKNKENTKKNLSSSAKAEY